MIYVIATTQVKPEGRDAFIRGHKECIAETRKEKGCVAYDINKGAERKYFFYEKWKDVDGLAAHVTADHTKKLLAKFADLIDGDAKIEFLPTVGD